MRGEGPMYAERAIDRLIEAGWYMLDSEFDPAAYRNWKERAFECVSALMGPQHMYTRYFSQFVDEDWKRSLLNREGILVAVKEQVHLSHRSDSGTRRNGDGVKA
jgi:hypothetical protein